MIFFFGKPSVYADSETQKNKKTWNTHQFNS